MDKKMLINFHFPINTTVEQIYLYPQIEIEPGYLHLLEHMVIRQNKEDFEKYENQNNIYNALTDKNKINFVFIHNNEDRIPLLTTFDPNFCYSDFELEKKIILEERKLYPDYYPAVDTVLGTLEQINRFEINKLKYLLDSKHFSIIHFKYALSIDSFVSRSEQRYQKECLFDYVINNQKGYLILQDVFLTNMFVYFLHIIEIVTFNIKFKVRKVNQNIEVIYPEQTEILPILSNKNQLMKRYKLFLTELRFHSQEMIYLVEKFNYIPEFEKYWEELSWEQLLIR